MRNTALQKARKSKNLTQWGLALSVGLKSGTSLSLYESYGIVPTWEVANKIADVLGVDVYELFPTIEEQAD